MSVYVREYRSVIMCVGISEHVRLFMNVNEYLQVCEYVCEYLALNSPQALM